MCVEIKFRDADGRTRKDTTEISVIKTPQGCEYRLEFNSPVRPPNWGIIEVGGDQGPPQRYLSAQCTPPKFVETATTNKRKFEEQTTYYWSKMGREYAKERLWITPPGWSSGPIKFANNPLGPNVLTSGGFVGGFNQACFPNPLSGCMRAWPGEGPRIFIRAGHARADIVAHEYGHYAAGYVFGHMDTLGFNPASCGARSFQETIAPIFQTLLQHGTRHEQLVSYFESVRLGDPNSMNLGSPYGPVDRRHNSTWTNACGETDYTMGEPLLQAFTQALWGSDYSGTILVPWRDAREANVTMANAFVYALAQNRGHRIDLLAFAILDWLSRQAPDQSSKITEIFASHGMAPRALGEQCSNHSDCRSGICDAGWETSKTNTCVPQWYTGRNGDHCSHDLQCSSSVCAGLHASGNAWIPGKCGDKAGLGDSCQQHHQCGSSACDAGWGTSKTNTCVPRNGTGRNGDHCSHDLHCSSSICAGLHASGNVWIPGKCADKAGLGDSCQIHHQCGSGICDAGWGTSKTDTCVPQWYTGKKGDHCTHHHQCSSYLCLGLHASGNVWIPGKCN